MSIRFLPLVTSVALALAGPISAHAQDEEDSHDADQDDTADIDTESTVDTADDRRFTFRGDVRPLVNYVEIEDRDGVRTTDSGAIGRLRLKGTTTIGEGRQLGARLAWRCSTDDCALDWVMQGETPAPNGLSPGQVTFDELYAHFFRHEKFNITVGRQQTRFVLRGGVFARSLDRNDSAGTSVTWTDGFHVTLRRREGWASHFIIQRNAADGSGSVRRGPLDFNDSAARNTYFVGVENTNTWGPIVQRSLNVSYLPKSLLKEGTTTGPRENYWGIVTRGAIRWPQRSEGPRLRAGIEMAYAPERPTSDALGIGTSADGLAWNIAASIIEFRPRHSVGVQYARTGAGWLLSPNFANNEEMFEVRYQWRPQRLPAIEVRFRWREDIEQLVDTARKREVLDAFVRLTWQFGR